MQEPKYRVRFVETTNPANSVQVSWKIEMPLGAGVPTSLDVLHNTSIISAVAEPTNRYGIFRLGSRILPQAELEGSFIIEGASLQDLLGVRVGTEDTVYRWSTNQPKPPFLHASPSGVFSRFEEDVTVGLSNLVTAQRNGLISWRARNEQKL